MPRSKSRRSKRAKHWTCDEICEMMSSTHHISIALESGDTAPNFASSKTQVYGPGSVEYNYNAMGGITTTPVGDARVL